MNHMYANPYAIGEYRGTDVFLFIKYETLTYLIFTIHHWLRLLMPQ